MSIKDRIVHAWNAFVDDDKNFEFTDGGITMPPMHRFSLPINDKSIVNSMYNRLAMDVAGIEFIHARLDDNGRYLGTINSGLNNCLNCEANLDQTARPFKQDLVTTIFEDGVAAVVAVDTDLNPLITGGFDVKTIRVGKIVAWHPKHVRLSVYNENKGVRQEITLPKNRVAIVENPLYSVMNEPNSMLQRLIRKLSIMDSVDNELVNKKLDVIIKVPYTIKSEARKRYAEKRREDIEFQLKSSAYGVAYLDGTEEVQQLNRPVENNILSTVEFMTKQVYSQLGLTSEILDGTAGEQVLLNYYKRTIEPIADSIAESLSRTFLTRTARTQKQSIIYLRKPFELVPMNDIAEIADKFTRNEIMTANEFRSIVGFKPIDDPKADELRNSNMPRHDTEIHPINSFQNQEE